MGTHSAPTLLLGAAICLGITLSGQPQATLAQVVADDVRCSGCVGKTDIGNRQVISRNIKSGGVATRNLKRGAVTSNKLADGSVSTQKIEDGAVTFSKLAEDAVFLRTVVVGPVGPSETDNCNELLSALDGITDASASNPYLIYVEPGNYDCGTSPIIMKSHVAIRGAGEGITKIETNVPSSDTVGAMIGASSTEVSHLSVTNTFSGTGNSYGYVSSGASEVVIRHAEFTGSGPSGQSNGMRIFGGSHTLQFVTATAGLTNSSTGIIFTQGAKGTLHSVIARSISIGGNSTGIFANSGPITAKNSVFAGRTRGVRTEEFGVVNLFGSEVDGGFTNVGTVRCIATYDRSFVAFDENCE